jgi:excisionase family DNA binding protein
MSPASLSDLPMLASPELAAEVMGVTPAQVRSLIRDGKIAHVPIGKRSKMIPRSAIEQFIASNTVQPCLAETQDRASVSSRNGDVFTSAGQSEVAAGSAARALQIAESLKSRSPNTSTPEHGSQGRVIRLPS